MKGNNTKSPLRFILIGIALSLMAGGVSADKPSWAGGGKNKEGKERHEDKERSDLGRDENRHAGCQPPGQAKKWQKGHPLPADITYYELPRELRVRLPVAPPNYRYVQIAGDILMIAVGTGMVVDAIEDILR